MAVTQLQQRYGADNSIYDVEEKAKHPSSVFDFSRKNITTIDIGQYMPIDWFRVFPGDEIELSNRFLLETLPLANPPLTNYRARIHWFFIKNSSLWKGWQSFITQGRTGSVQVKKIPSLSQEDLKGSLLPSSLAVSLGLPCCEYLSDAAIQDGESFYTPNFPQTLNLGAVKQLSNRSLPVDGVSALPFLFYQKVWRFDVAPTNLLQSNQVWFPEDLSEEWRINYLAENLTGKFFVPHGTVPENYVENSSTNVPSVSDKVVNLAELRYACYENDYFTTAKPWLVRGDEESSASLDVTGLDASIDVDDFVESLVTGDISKPMNPSTYGWATMIFSPTGDEGGAAVVQKPDFSLNQTQVNALRSNLLNTFNKLKIKNSASVKASLTANRLREMLAYSVWQERNALTNGNYNEFIKVHFTNNPKTPDFEPYYLGGLVQQLQFSQILQTSSSISESPLGSQASIGSANGQGSVFKFKFNDFGMVMGVMFITPEVFYTQGVGHEWTDLLPEDQFMPEFSQTGFEPILNQEIYPQGSSGDKQLFGYQTRNAYLKARMNRASGLMSLTPEIDKLFGSYVQAREFSELPKLSIQFVQLSPDNVRRDFLAYTKYPAFKLQIATDVRLVRNLPYKSTPNTFGF